MKKKCLFFFSPWRNKGAHLSHSCTIIVQLTSFVFATNPWNLSVKTKISNICCSLHLGLCQTWFTIHKHCFLMTGLFIKNCFNVVFNSWNVFSWQDSCVWIWSQRVGIGGLGRGRGLGCTHKIIDARIGGETGTEKCKFWWDLCKFSRTSTVFLFWNWCSSALSAAQGENACGLQLKSVSTSF